MKAVIQRVKSSVLHCEGKKISQINEGLVIYLGVGIGDAQSVARALADKIVKMRILSDSEGKMNLSVKDLNQQIMCVSQFTLLADTSHGNRPSFTLAEKPVPAKELYDYFCDYIMAQHGIEVAKGVFGGDMTIEQVNDGPVTIVIDSQRDKI